MSNIISFKDFGGGLLAKKKKYEQLWPGTKVEGVPNIDIIAYRDGKEWPILDDNVVSPMVKLKLFRKPQPDPSIYELIFFNKGNFSVTTGVKVRYKDTDVNDVKINAGVQCRMQCNISDSSLIINNFNMDDELTVTDVKQVIVDKCAIIVRSEMANTLRSSGDVDAQEDLKSVGDSVKRQLNEELKNYGLNVSSVSINYETDSEHDAMVYEIGMNEYVTEKTSDIANRNKNE